MQISVFGYPAKDGGVMGGVLGVRVCFFVFVYVVVVGGLACLEKRGEESWKEWWMHGGWTEEVWCTYDWDCSGFVYKPISCDENRCRNRVFPHLSPILNRGVS